MIKIITCGELIKIHDVLEDIYESNITFDFKTAVKINNFKKTIDDKFDELISKMVEVIPKIMDDNPVLSGTEQTIYDAMLLTETEIEEIDIPFGNISLKDVNLLKSSTVDYILNNK